MKEADSNIEAVSRAFAAIAEGDIDQAVTQLDQDAKWDVAHALPEGGHYEGRDAIREMLRRQQQRLGNFRRLHTIQARQGRRDMDAYFVNLIT